MARAFHTEEEIIPVASVQNRWSITCKEMTRLVIYDELTVFFSRERREKDNIIYFVGFEVIYTPREDDIRFVEEDLYTGMMGRNSEEPYDVEVFLLKNEVIEYEKKNPYLLTDPIPTAEWKEFPVRLKDSLPAPLAKHSEELAACQKRIAELEEQLALAIKEPDARTKTSYLKMLDALLLHAKIDCLTIDWNKGSGETTTVGKWLDAEGRHLSEGNVRNKLKEIQNFAMDYPRWKEEKSLN